MESQELEILRKEKKKNGENCLFNIRDIIIGECSLPLNTGNDGNGCGCNTKCSCDCNQNSRCAPFMG